MVSFEDRVPNVKANLLHVHGNSLVNMVDSCPGEHRVSNVIHIRRSLVELHKNLCLISDCEYDHDSCIICSVNPHGCVIMNRDVQKLVDEGMIHICQARDRDDDVNVIFPVFRTHERVVIQFDSSKKRNRSVSPLVIRLAGLVPYTSDKVVPYRSVFSKAVENVIVGVKAEVVPLVDPINTSICQSRKSSSLKSKDDNDEVLCLIKKSKVNVVEQLLQTPSKIFVLSLFMNSEAHHEALQKVIEQAYVEHDVKVDQLDHIIANITSCNNLSFCDEELPEEGRNHNLALHISMNCKEDALSNILVNIGSSLNVLPKSTWSRISYKGAPMRYSGVIVKVFDASRKTVIGEVDLPIKIGPSDFQITFQVMDIHPTYSCLLGRPWIHEASDVTWTLHQKLKFVKNGKLVIVVGALLVSHLSSFMYVEAEEEVGTMFQALSIENVIQKTWASMSSLKDAQEIVQAGDTDNLGRVVEVVENKNRAGLGFEQGTFKKEVKAMQQISRSRGFIHKEEQDLAAIIHEDEDEEEVSANFVTHGQICNNWVVVDVLVIIHYSK
ncbi:hypothetical protein KIW84_044147 [Lathyrus oleraceus]|uniref:Uncharacterized protein n=1 Tax=Pisum sativum TaxID=3888 RepID=A0A9D4XJI4_PEA|nr:hypothetical protein KIW84_044147 [Pisum sativum]